MSEVAGRVIAAMGPAVGKQAGDLLEPLVEGLTAPLEDTDVATRPVGIGWPALADLATSGDPEWIAKATGTVVPRGLTPDAVRALIAEQGGWRRGTATAMLAAARTVYPTGLITFVERNGSPWQSTIRLYAANATPGDQARVLAAASLHKPVGISLTVEIVTGASYAHLSDEAPTYDALRALYPTYREMRAHLPEEGTVP